MNDTDKMMEIICGKITEVVEMVMENYKTKFERCLVENVNSNGTVAVRYDTRLYDNTKVMDNIALSKGQAVIMCIPNGNIEKRFILGWI